MPERSLHPDPETLRAVEGVELRSRLVVEGLLSGGHRTPLSGVSTEFAQHRPYVAGDDLRHLDWKVLARTDKAHLRQFERESQLELTLAVDRSASMRFAGGAGGAVRPGGRTRPDAWSKFDHAAVLAGTLAHLGTRQRDRVGLVLFDAGVSGGLPPSNASGHAEEVTAALDAAGVAEAEASGGEAAEEDDRGAGLLAAAGRIAGGLGGGGGRRGLVVILADLLDPVAALESALGRLRHGGANHDTLVLQVLDPVELDLGSGPGGDEPAEFVGLEGGGRVGADPRSLRKAYRAAVGEHLAAVGAACTRFGYDHRLMRTDEPPGAQLAAALAQRSSAMRA
ncbi:DUF58 domain-containing protein [Phycisphaera mikurensis]|uniref:DUF58 domain-containing protein n=1 Tax=Phycisphaera mikurensis (strain NBRC 102666 / KCTC 22515 / FYK2301M01) TaxID=1142394 RepID=I0IIG0_PHYMF|nr:DUF58 domain-containing protein [Phycisphaera mikurensis]MBB6442388.1 uncharacterized protein (DUF58 family) [Phycisphaera mikurensis]BAM05048.1 hypothetical protein PSMK_28890 [Phycisphaera mikurensis NBRC 102666]